MRGHTNANQMNLSGSRQLGPLATCAYEAIKPLVSRGAKGSELPLAHNSQQVYRVAGSRPKIVCRPASIPGVAYHALSGVVAMHPIGEFLDFLVH